MEKQRLEKIVEELLFYVLELKKHEDTEERISFFKNCIGMTEKEIKYFGIK